MRCLVGCMQLYSVAAICQLVTGTAWTKATTDKRPLLESQFLGAFLNFLCADMENKAGGQLFGAIDSTHVSVRGDERPGSAIVQIRNRRSSPLTSMPKVGCYISVNGTHMSRTCPIPSGPDHEALVKSIPVKQEFAAHVDCWLRSRGERTRTFIYLCQVEHALTLAFVTERRPAAHGVLQYWGQPRLTP